MERVILERLETGDQGTFGKIFINEHVFFTGELSWRENESNISCIPVGIYKCTWTLSPHFKRKMYQVNDVDNRTAIRIHSANFMGDSSRGFRKQLNGCIALGERLADMAGQKSLILSASAVRKFESLLGQKPFILEIIDGI